MPCRLGAPTGNAGSLDYIRLSPHFARDDNFYAPHFGRDDNFYLPTLGMTIFREDNFEAGLTVFLASFIIHPCPIHIAGSS